MARRHLVFIATLMVGCGGAGPRSSVGLPGRLIVDEDWNDDGRKDRRSGMTRPEVTQWLAKHPRWETAALAAVVDLAIHGSCRDARIALTMLARSGPVGSAMARVRRQAALACR